MEEPDYLPLEMRAPGAARRALNRAAFHIETQLR
jgi:hypothetical protein